MSQLAEMTKFIGRRNEINEFAEILANAASGSGQLIFINGEAGVGKTRFIQEIRSLPIGQQFNWLTASCIYQEGTDPYLPFIDALRSWFGPRTPISKGQLAPAHEQSISTQFKFDDLTKIPIIGPKLVEEPSMSFGSFMIKEPKSEFSLAIFSALINHGRNGLCISRIPPEKLERITKSDNMEVFWLSSKPSDHSIPPSLTKLSHTIIEFLKKKRNSIVLIDGLEYLIGHIDFNRVLRFINELVDTMAMYKSILIIPINPLTIDPKQLALFERNMNTIDITTNEDISPVDDTREITYGGIEKFNEEKLQQGRDRIFETATQQVFDIAATKPVALFIDDLHWADVGALHLLHYLARASENRHVAIIGAYRPEDLADTIKSHPLQTLLDRLIPEKLLKSISLDRFDKLEASEMIQSLLHNSEFPKELIEFIYQETEGNPFFIEEVIRSLEEDGAIMYSADRSSWSLTKRLSDIGLPETIKDVVHSRINRLPKKSREILEIASVIGVEFNYNTLATVSKLDEEKLVRNLDDFISFNLIKELPTKFGQPISYRFAHNKICEVLYNGLGQSHKRLLHSKAAVVIEERFKGNLDNVIYELAQHCYNGGDYKRSLQYAINAGEKALRNFAPEKARTFYKWALDSFEFIEIHFDESDTHKKLLAEILLKLIEICLSLGELDEALKYTRKLLKLSEEIDDHNKKADAYIFEGQINSHRCMWDEAKEHLNKALTLSKDSEYQPGMLEAFYGLGFIVERMGNYKQAMEYFQHFTKVAESMDSQLEIARGLKASARILHDREEYKSAIEFYKKCIELLSKTNFYHELASTYTNMGVTYFELDEFDKVIECHEKCIEIAKRIGEIRMLGYGYSNAAEVYAHNHELDKALDYANKAHEIFTKLDEKSMIGLVLMNYGIIYKNKSDWDSSRYYFEKSLALLKDLKTRVFQADCTRQYGLMLTAQGTSDALKESRKYLQKSLEIYKEVGVKRYINILQDELDKLPIS